MFSTDLRNITADCVKENNIAITKLLKSYFRLSPFRFIGYNSVDT